MSVLTRTHTAIGRRPGAAVVLPAYNESRNLRRTVESICGAFREAGTEVSVVIVDDGGSDGTPELSSALAEEFPDCVVAHHRDQHGAPYNQGYGTAIRTGISTALETNREYVILMDSDGQFDAAELPRILEYAQLERTEAVFGYRKHRADPLKRKLMGAGWTLFSRLWLRYWIRDVDCAVKVFWAPALAKFQLRGEYAAISPELVAWSRANGLHTKQYGVSHLPREDEESQTGARLGVVLRSFTSAAAVYLNLVRQGQRLPHLQRLWSPRDRPAYFVTLMAMLLALAGLGLAWYTKAIIAYPDAVSHLIISRRVIDSPTPGLGQLGAVWLPLPHLLVLWGVGFNALYYTGLVGSIISMIAFVVTARYLYKLGVHLTGHVFCGIIAAAVVMVNANVLYMQSTPMTELLLLACLSAAAYHLSVWCQTERWRQLAAASLAVLLGTLTRYEAWAALLAMLVIVIYVELRRSSRLRQRVHSLKRSLIFFGYISGMGIAAWMMWSWLITKNPFYFQNGAFAKPSLWVSSGDKAIGNLWVAVQTYVVAMAENLTWPVVVLAAAGLLYYVIKTRLRPEMAGPLILWVFVPFFIYSLYSGQRPLHVPQVTGHYYNVRFGLVMVLAAAVFIAYLASTLVKLRAVVSWPVVPVATSLIVGLLIGATVWAGPPATWREGKSFQAGQTMDTSRVVSDWLQNNYDGGHMLLEHFGNEMVTFLSRVPTSDIVYEGSNKKSLWQRSLKEPKEAGIQWIYMRQRPKVDDVWTALHDSPQLQAYEMVYKGSDQLIYRLITQPPFIAKHTVTADPPAIQQRAAPPMNKEQAAPAVPQPQAQPPRTALVKPVMSGRAAWFRNKRGACDADGVAVGSTIQVVRRSTGKKVTCVVRGPGPRATGVVVNLPYTQFRELAPLSTGLVEIDMYLLRQ